MELNQSLDELLNTLSGTLTSSRFGNLELYLEGVRIKISESQIALERIKYYGRIRSGDTTDGISDVEKHIQFYVDSFFAFLYSSFDVVAQVINIRFNLKVREKDVSFNKVIQKFNNENINADLQSVLNTIKDSNYFKNLDNYRNCSTHRREICLKTVNNEISKSYKKYAGDLNSLQRFICDNPLSLKPTFKRDRELVDYSEKMYHKMVENLICIIKKLG